MHYLFRNNPQPKRPGGGKIHSGVHFDYIMREGEYKNLNGHREDLVFSENGNMPQWAEENPSDFWDAADTYGNERSRGYREFLLGLQEELTLEENIECVHELLKKTGIANNHVYSFAIHDKTATFDDAHRNIHCHLMFNEKTIEKDRPLEPEKFFKRYSQDKEGNVTGGYKNNRIFKPKETNLMLRHQWAEIVNKKFAEKGLDCRIDERTLQAQKEELLAQGKTEEAKYFDRKPGPNLHGIYMNKKIRQKIDAAIEEFSKNKNNEKEPELPENATNQDKIIYAFAKDYTARMVMRQMQKERLAVMQAIQKDKEAVVSSELNLDRPFVITVENIKEEFTERIEKYEQAAGSAQREIKLLAGQIVPLDRIKKEAQNRIAGPEYKALKDEIAKDIKEKKELTNLRKEFETSDLYLQYSASQKDAHDQLKQYLSIKSQFENVKSGEISLDLTQTKELKSQVEVEFNEYKRLKEISNVIKMAPEFKNYDKLGTKILAIQHNLDIKKETLQTYLDLASPERIEREIKSIKENNERLNLKIKALAKEKFTAEHKISWYEEQIEQLESLDEKQIIFKSRIPPSLNRNMAIDGTAPIKNLPQLQHNNDTYFIIEQDEGKHKYCMAIRKGDFLQKGKVPIYKITLKEDAQDKVISSVDVQVPKVVNSTIPVQSKTVQPVSKIQSIDASKVVSIEKTNQECKLYAEQSKKSKDGISAKPVIPAIQNKVKEITDEAEKNKDLHIRIQWNKDEKEVDQVLQAEKDAQRSWEQNMRFIGRSM